MTELDIVNGCLSLIGELPVESLLEDHGFVPAARQIFREENASLQAQSWWFNREGGLKGVALIPQLDGRIHVAADIIRVEAGPNYTVRGAYMYDLENGTPIIGKIVWARVTRLVPLEDLPHVAAVAVQLRTQAIFNMRHGDATERSPAVQAAGAMADLHAEETRQVKVSPLGGANWRAELSYTRKA